ncbi:AAA family ATPase [Streptomyces yangpuensis]|uniref:AAA family ATPase n=1 Tax=Streptomyces yangpuensis TaxID=1648182 RepID=UPI0035DA0B59
MIDSSCKPYGRIEMGMGSVASIAPEHVAKAANAISEIGSSRSDIDVTRLLAFKRMGLIPGKSVSMSNADAKTICDDLYGVPGHEPNAWYDPFTSGWRKTASNGGWPVGSIKTQMERPNLNISTILNGEKEGPCVTVSMADWDEYHESLATKFSCKRFPLEQAIIWFFRNRTDLPDVDELDVLSLLDDFIEFFHLSPGELEKVFTDATQAFPVALTTNEPEQPLGLLLPPPQRPKDRMPASPVEQETEKDGFEWTKEFSERTFQDVDVRGLVESVKMLADARDLVLPDADSLIERCVVGLLSGHLVLQGPPGTGKTTLARLLAEAFSADTAMTTATADWTTYEVIGGLRPSHDGTLEPVLGAVPMTALSCAEKMRAATVPSASVTLDSDPSDVGANARWLIIDELNRADIDRAIGGLYTVLSSADSRHLAATPIDLWFEPKPSRRLLWVPGCFRIIGTMNDVDTSFVNSISQGLTRRFQFVYVGVPDIDQIDVEMELCQRQAQEWLESQYPYMAAAGQKPATQGVLNDMRQVMRDIFAWLRFGEKKSGSQISASWPVGSAQAVDLWKAVLLTLSSDLDGNKDGLVRAFDACFADRIIPQMGTLRASHIAQIQEYFEKEHHSLQETRRAIRHLRNTQSVR